MELINKFISFFSRAIKSKRIYLAFIWFLLLGSIYIIGSVCFADKLIKYPVVSGSFYPKDKNALAGQINSFLSKVEEGPFFNDKEILGLMSPHAGYVYSGQVAAHGYKAIQGRSYDAVVVMAPSHAYPFEGISVYKEGFFRTPLGDIEVDTELSAELLKYNQNDEI